MGPYHAIMVHFPVALWTVAAFAIVLRALSAGPLARAFDRVLVPLLVMGVGAGLGAYMLGQLVWPPATLQATPLGRNHMMGATWSLSYWAALLFLRWRVGERAWEGPLNRAIMGGLGAIGGTLLAITGTLGGHLHGAPAQLSEVLRMLGFDVYQTYYVPTWALVLVALAIVAMPIVAIAASRRRVGPGTKQEPAT